MISLVVRGTKQAKIPSCGTVYSSCKRQFRDHLHIQQAFRTENMPVRLAKGFVFSQHSILATVSSWQVSKAWWHEWHGPLKEIGLSLTTSDYRVLCKSLTALKTLCYLNLVRLHASPPTILALDTWSFHRHFWPFLTFTARVLLNYCIWTSDGQQLGRRRPSRVFGILHHWQLLCWQWDRSQPDRLSARRRTWLDKQHKRAEMS